MGQVIIMCSCSARNAGVTLADAEVDRQSRSSDPVIFDEVFKGRLSMLQSIKCLIHIRSSQFVVSDMRFLFLNITAISISMLMARC